MTVFVALLRGINVGGAGKLAMADLRGIAEGCGFADVRTYVQSGNVVFRARGSAMDVTAQLRGAIAAASSVDPPIAIRTDRQLSEVVTACPFDDTAHVHVTFLLEGATASTPKLDEDGFTPERFEVRGRETYLYLPSGIGRSNLAQALSRGAAAGAGTTRNWRTVTKLAVMADEASAARRP